MPREFERVFTRRQPLFSGQYWYLGEAIKTREVTKGAAWYEPMFLYEPEVGVGVYYETKGSGKSLDRPMIEYFKQNLAEFDRLCDVYEQQCLEMREIVEGKRSVDFFDLYTREADAWPQLAMVCIVGAYPEESGEELAKKAMQLRAKTDAVSYLVDDFMLEHATELFGEHGHHVPFLTMEEIVARNLPSSDELEARRAGYAILDGVVYSGISRDELVRRFECTLIEAEDEEASIDERLPSDESSSPDSVRGRTAYPGVVLGRVRLVRTKEDLPKFQAGEILVSWMTTPDLMSAIHHAAAIVTDEGSITCHAAIVSRELKIPCVTGTRNATKILKDGDEVEVDATRGVVTLIQRATL